MKTLKESILDNIDVSLAKGDEYAKIIDTLQKITSNADKLDEINYNKDKRYKHSNNSTDLLGRKLNIGDLVLIVDSSTTYEFENGKYGIIYNIDKKPTNMINAGIWLYLGANQFVSKYSSAKFSNSNHNENITNFINDFGTLNNDNISELCEIKNFPSTSLILVEKSNNVMSALKRLK